jgi:hypothetical protein
MRSHVEIEEILAYLKRQHLVTAIEVLFCDATLKRSVYKLRCRLIPDKYQLYIRIIQTPIELVYSYQLLTDLPIVRWDNAPHFPAIPSFPHHFHDQAETVHSSSLQGGVFADLDIVFAEVKDVIQRLELTK